MQINTVNVCIFTQQVFAHQALKGIFASLDFSISSGLFCLLYDISFFRTCHFFAYLQPCVKYAKICTAQKIIHLQ